MEIRKVIQRKDGIKLVSIPKHSEIKRGDYVLITNNLNLVSKFQKEEKNV